MHQVSIWNMMEYMSTQSGSQHHTLSLLERRETYTIMTIIRIMTVTVIGEEGDIHDNDGLMKCEQRCLRKSNPWCKSEKRSRGSLRCVGLGEQGRWVTCITLMHPNKGRTHSPPHTPKQFSLVRHVMSNPFTGSFSVKRGPRLESAHKDSSEYEDLPAVRTGSPGPLMRSVSEPFPDAGSEPLTTASQASREVGEPSCT